MVRGKNYDGNLDLIYIGNVLSLWMANIFHNHDQLVLFRLPKSFGYWSRRLWTSIYYYDCAEDQYRIEIVAAMAPLIHAPSDLIAAWLLETGLV